MRSSSRACLCFYTKEQQFSLQGAARLLGRLACDGHWPEQLCGCGLSSNVVIDLLLGTAGFDGRLHKDVDFQQAEPALTTWKCGSMMAA
jgi:hypothetical protein